MGKKSRVKGASGERQAAQVFRENGWPDAHRLAPMQCGHAADYADLGGTGLLSVEVKRHRKVPVVRLFADAMKREIPGFELVLAHRDDDGIWLGTMKLDRLAVLAARDRDNLALVARLKAGFPEVYAALTCPLRPLDLDEVVHPATRKAGA